MPKFRMDDCSNTWLLRVDQLPAARKTRILSILAFAITMLCSMSCCAQDAVPQAPIQELRLNLFLGQWQVLGPLPLETTGSSALEHEYFEDEADFRGGNARFYRNRLFTWKSVNSRIVDLRGALASGVGGENCMGYAWTQFISDKDQRLRMGVAHDDKCAFWLNGKLIGRNPQTMPSFLDQAVYDVDVKKGVNSLLLKVENGTRHWDFAVRFLPADVTTPLLEFNSIASITDLEFPAVGIDVLDDSGKSLVRHFCSGKRKSWNNKTACYRLFAKPPPGKPRSVRIVAKHPGFANYSKTYSWDEITSGLVELDFRSDQPVQMVVKDGDTGQPIQGAVVWDRWKARDAVSNSEGNLHVPDFTPAVPECWVNAPGYLAQKVQLDWPRRKTHRIFLSRGGCTLTGQIGSETGKPVANATIKLTASSYPQFQPEFKSDQNGRFRIHGFLPTKPNFKATVTARGFETNKDLTFTVSNSKPTNVTWSLSPGILVAGKVTHVKTGLPIPGIQIMTGESRYASDKSTAITDKNGIYELVVNREGTQILTAMSDRHAPAVTTVTAERGKETKADFQVDEGASIRGFVKDQRGQPIANAQVYVDSWKGKRVFSRRALSDSKGIFILPNMPETGEMRAYARMDGYVTSVTSALTANDSAEFKLRARIDYTFHVTANDKTVPGLRILKGYKFSGQDDYSWQSSSSSVMQSYNASTGDFTTSVNDSTDYTVAFRFVANGFDEKIFEVPAEASESKTIALKLDPAKQFAGIVVDAESGEPKPGIAVTLLNGSDYMRSSSDTVWQYLLGDRYSGSYAMTDAEGKFLLSVPPANKKTEFVLASADGSFHHIGNLSEEIFESTDTPLTLPFPEPASIRGTYMIDGKPIADQAIRIAWSGQSGRSDNGWTLFQAETRTTTDAEGKFESIRLAPGRYQIGRVLTFRGADSINHSSYVGSEDITLMPGEVKTHSVNIPQGFTINGIAKDPDGNPLSNVHIYATRQNGTRQNVTEAAAMSDGSGRFKLEHLSAGTYQLNGSHYAIDSNGSYNTKYRVNQTISVFESMDDFEFKMRDSGDRSSYAYNRVQALPKDGTVAPKFEITTINPSNRYDSDQLYGKVVAICFWHLHSQDLTVIQKAYEQYSDNPDVVFLSVCSASDVDSVRSTMKQQNVDFPVAFYDQLRDRSQLPYLLGTTSGGCVVIDREGRFAGEVLESPQLSDAIEKALAIEKASEKMSRLKLRVSAGDESMIVSGAQLSLRAFNKAGEMVTLNTYRSPAVRDVTWRYPAIEAGGKLIVIVSCKGMKNRSETIDDPAATENLLLNIQAPRKISGRIIDQENKPVQGMQVLVYGFQNGVHTTTTNTNGEYSVGCFPGQYQLMPQNNDEHAVAVDHGQQVLVGSDQDPRAVNFKASPAITIRGTVLNANGKPASDGTVMIGSSSPAKIGKDGTYSLPGVPSVGESQVMAQVSGQYGMAKLTNPTANKEYKIQIGQGFEDASTSITVQGDATPLDLQTLEGEPVRWEASGSGNRCLLFCALWHPRSAELIDAAAAKAKENNAELQIISLDFSLSQAFREAKRLKLTGVFYGGSQGLTLPAEWKFFGDYQCVIVSAAGQFASKPTLVAQ